MLQLKLKYILSLAVFIILFLAAGCGPSQYGFDQWDSNDNDLIENGEFNQGLYDSEHYSNWDSDGDGSLTEEEWSAGTESWSDYNGNVGFSDWDLNNDKEISEDEFGNGFFDTVDEDNNYSIDQNEWDLFDSEEDGLF